MGFLDEVKQKRAAEQPNSQTDLPMVAKPSHLQAIQPQIHALHEFLERFVQGLNSTPPKVRVGYQVSNFGKMQVLNQGDYAVIADDEENPTQVALQFCCRGPRTLVVEANNREKNQWQQDFLLEHGFRFHCKSHADWRYILTIEEFVPVSFSFFADDKEALIRLEIRNGESLGIERHTFAPTQISADFMEELAKRVLRKANRFDELCGDRVSSDARREFRAKIAARQIERESELGDAPAEKPNAKTSKLGGVFRWRKNSEPSNGRVVK